MDRIHDLMSLLKSSLQLEFPAYFFTSAEAVAGEPTLSIYQTAGGATGNFNAFIRILQKPYAGYPTATLTGQPLGGTSLIQLALENTAAAAGIAFPTAIQLAKLISRIKDLTVDIDVYMSVTTVVPVIATVNDATKYVGTVSSNIRVPNIGQ